MARLILALALVVACDARKTALTDVTTVDPVRVAFNAHKGEARFLTLLSPT